jgi:capsule polysaccharide export protein KpsE/RkpR
MKEFEKMESIVDYKKRKHTRAIEISKPKTPEPSSQSISNQEFESNSLKNDDIAVSIVKANSKAKTPVSTTIKSRIASIANSLKKTSFKHGANNDAEPLNNQAASNIPRFIQVKMN